MEERFDGLLEYLAQDLDECKDFPVVAQKKIQRAILVSNLAIFPL